MIDDLKKWAADERKAGHLFAAETLDAAIVEIEQLHKAIRLMDAQLGDGEGVGIMHYLEHAYPGDAIVGHDDIVDLVRGILSKGNPDLICEAHNSSYPCQQCETTKNTAQNFEADEGHHKCSGILTGEGLAPGEQLDPSPVTSANPESNIETAARRFYEAGCVRGSQEHLELEQALLDKGTG